MKIETKNRYAPSCCDVVGSSLLEQMGKGPTCEWLRLSVRSGSGNTLRKGVCAFRFKRDADAHKIKKIKKVIQGSSGPP
jgi:hypothetical protein